MVENEEQTEIDVNGALHSSEYNGYLLAASELDKVNLNTLSQKEKICFFLNIYQCMYIHFYLKSVSEERPVWADLSYFRRAKQLVADYYDKPFFYSIAGMRYTLDEIKHGLLRSNKKSPHYWFPSLTAKDMRLGQLKCGDPRVNFVCFDWPNSAEHIEDFSSEDELDDKLNSFVYEYLMAKVNVDTMNGEIALPKILETYKADFGGTEESILRFVWRHFDCEELDENAVVREVCTKKSLLVRYE